MSEESVKKKELSCRRAITEIERQSKKFALLVEVESDIFKTDIRSAYKRVSVLSSAYSDVQMAFHNFMQAVIKELHEEIVADFKVINGGTRERDKS